MSNEWRINRGDVQGGQSGEFLDGCEVRQKADGSGYEFLAVLAESQGNELPARFPPFAYEGLIWNIDIEKFEQGSRGEQPRGHWSNNARQVGPPAEEDGTWTAQAGSGLEEEGREDAASASA
jgi:hypothetical protein